MIFIRKSQWRHPQHPCKWAAPSKLHVVMCFRTLIVHNGLFSWLLYSSISCGKFLFEDSKKKINNNNNNFDS
jgi:hypothetical protein